MEEKTDTKKIIEEQRLTRMQIAQMISEQQLSKKESKKWGIAIFISLILLIIAIAVQTYFMLWIG